MEKEKIVITFDEKNHIYTVNGEIAVSVTTVLREVGLAKDYSNEPPFVLERIKKAAEKGNYYDKLAEEAVNSPFELNEWQTRFLKVLEENDLEPLEAQPRVATMKPFVIAGSGDLRVRHKKTNRHGFLDLKATYMIYKRDVTWQNNTYAWIDKKENSKDVDKYVLHYNENDDRFTFLQLEHIEKELIEEMLECYQLGERFGESEEKITSIINIQEFSNAFDKVKAIEKDLKLKKIELDKIYADVKEGMKESGIATLDLENFKITYTPETQKTTVAYKKMMEKEVLEKKKRDLFLEKEDLIEGFNLFLEENEEELKKLKVTDEDKREFSTTSTVSDKLTVTELKKEIEQEEVDELEIE